MRNRITKSKWFFLSAQMLVIASAISASVFSAKRQQPKNEQEGPRVTSMPPVFSKVKNLEVVRGQQGKERAVQIKTYKNQPVDIVAVKVKGAPVEPGRKLAGDSDWFNGMTVTLKNVSDKPVVFATVFVAAPHEKNGVRTQVEGADIYANIELMYGEPPPMPGDLPRSNRVPPLMPGQTADLLLDERWRDEFYSRLRRRDSSTDIPELTLSVFQVAFLGDDDTMWMHGFWRRRDPKNPMSWLTIDDPPRLNTPPENRNS